MRHSRLLVYHENLNDNERYSLQANRYSCYREDLLFVCRCSAKSNDELLFLRSLLFRNTKFNLNAWQVLSLRSDKKMSRLRWNMTQLIESYVVELGRKSGRCRKEIIFIAHAIEYYLFLTAPDRNTYEDMKQLRRRSLQMISLMAKRIRFRQKRQLLRPKCASAA